MMKTFTILCFSTLLMACAQTQIEPDVTEGMQSSPAFNAWLDAEFAEYLDFSPLTKTRLGDKSDYDKLDDASEAGELARVRWRRDSVAEMRRRFDRDLLDEQARLSWDLWVYLQARDEAGLPFIHHRYFLGRYGPHTQLPRNLISNHKVDSADDMNAYIARLNSAGRYLSQYLTRAKQSAAEGIRAPYFTYEVSISQIQRVIQGAPFDETGSSALWTDINGKLQSLQERKLLTAEAAGELRASAKVALLSQVEPVYLEMKVWLEQDRENVADVATGASGLPNGEAFYKYRLEQMTTLPLSAKEIHETGLIEVARIHAEMNRLKQRIGFDGDLQEFFIYMREDSQFYLPSTDAGRDEYIRLATVHLDKMTKRLPAFFGILPKSELEVRRVEAYREQAGGAAHYNTGTKDGSRPGVFYAHLIDMSATPVYRLENLAYHEGLPGHHMQLSIQMELEDIPRFRTFHGYTAYSEGWGLYSEWLAKEMGGYEDDYSDFGRLSGELWRAIRLVVDTGIHAFGWSERRAAQYALDNSPKPKSAVTSEIRRYFNMPGQATAYKIGMLKIQALRADAETQLGERFDIRKFHDLLLGSGSLPLPLLEQRVEGWVSSEAP